MDPLAHRSGSPVCRLLCTKRRSTEASACHGWSLPRGPISEPRLGILPSLFLVWYKRKSWHLSRAHCVAATVPAIFPRECYEGAGALPILQERTWSTESLWNFPESALGFEPRLSQLYNFSLPSISARSSCPPRTALGPGASGHWLWLGPASLWDLLF